MLTTRPSVLPSPHFVTIEAVDSIQLPGVISELRSDRIAGRTIDAVSSCAYHVTCGCGVITGAILHITALLHIADVTTD